MNRRENLIQCENYNNCGTTYLIFKKNKIYLY